MVQLSNDCFAFGGKLMTIDEALALIATRVQPVDGKERLPLFDCDNRILVSPLRAPVPLPLFANSAVDGYALRGADLSRHRPRAGRRGCGPHCARVRRAHLHRRAHAPGRRYGLHAGGCSHRGRW